MPRAWQRHGDLVLLSEDSLRAAPWEKLGKGSGVCLPTACPQSCPGLSQNSRDGCIAGPVLWETVASALGARRLARRGRVLPDGMRSPSVTLLLGQDGWVEHMDNGIR